MSTDTYYGTDLGQPSVDTSTTSLPGLCEATQSIIGKAGTGAVIALDAIGQQDTYLTGNVFTDSFFHFNSVKHSNFTKYSASFAVTADNSSNWPFNQKLSVNMRPKAMGDILENMYLKCTLPPLSVNQRYCDDVGWVMIKQMQFMLDDIVIETLNNDWNVIYSELHYLREEKTILRQLINVDRQMGGDLYIPLNFFFNRRHSTTYTANPLIKTDYFKPAFYTCAAYNHKNMFINFWFNPITSFCSDASANISLSNVYLVTDEIILDAPERQYLQNTKMENIISLSRNDPVTPVLGTPFKANLTPNVPVKTIHWFLRNAKYEDLSNVTFYNDRFNYSDKEYSTLVATPPNFETQHPIISQTIMYLNGVQILTVSLPLTSRTEMDGSYYYKYGQSYNHGLSTPTKNIYTYSFCLDPKNPQPSGALDFSQMDSNSTLLTGSLYSRAFQTAQWNLNVYYTGYNQITYSNGLVSLMFSGI